MPRVGALWGTSQERNTARIGPIVDVKLDKESQHMTDEARQLIINLVRLANSANLGKAANRLEENGKEGE